MLLGVLLSGLFGIRRARYAYLYRHSSGTATYNCSFAHSCRVCAAPVTWFHLHESPVALPVPYADIHTRASASLLLPLESS